MKIAKPILPSTPSGPDQGSTAPAMTQAKRAANEAVFQGMQDLWSSRLGPDDTLKVRFGENDEFTLQGKEPGPGNESFMDGAKKFFLGAAREVTIAAQSGPCLALSLAGEMCKPLVLLGVSPELTATVDSFYTPAMRGLCIGLSGIQFIEGWKHLNKKKADNKPIATADFINMGVTGLHMLPSAVAVAGAVAVALVPSMKHMGYVGLGIGYAGDALAFGANRLQYVADRARIKEQPITT